MDACKIELVSLLESSKKNISPYNNIRYHMNEPMVHNYAFRKALGYIGNKKGTIEVDAIRTSFENAVHQKISTQSPFLPTYIPLKSFILLLQLIKNRLGDENITTAGMKTNRCYDVGFYLYAGPEETSSPYQYLDPTKQLSKVVIEFYHNLSTPSGVIKNCGTTLIQKDSKMTGTWEKCGEFYELFQYLEGVHAGMIRTGTGEGVLSAKKEGEVFIFEIDLVE